MFKIFATAAALSLAASAALAGSTTIEFAPDEGDAVSFTFNSTDGTFTNTAGDSGTYSFDPETNTICGVGQSGEEQCATFESTGDQEVGASGRYTNSAGGSGVATITAKE